MERLSKGHGSSFLLSCCCAVWPGCEGHTVLHTRANHHQVVCVWGGGDARGPSLTFQKSVFQRQKEQWRWSPDRVPGRMIIFEIWLRRQNCAQCLCLFSRRTPIFWSSSWPSVLKARTFELKSKTCKLLENSLVDDQHLVWSGRLSPSSTSSRWLFEPRFEPKFFPQADTWALHLGIKGPVGLRCAQPPSTFICSPERGLAGLCPLADSCSCNLSSPGQNQVVEIRNWD